LRKLIGVIGGAKVDLEIYNEAYELGKILGKINNPIICGGGSGVMEAVSKGASESGGQVIGIMPGDRDGANQYLDIALTTNMGMARNAIIAQSSDVIIAISGEYGTLSELAFALQSKKPVIAYRCAFAKNLNIIEAESFDEIEKFVMEHIN